MSNSTENQDVERAPSAYKSPGDEKKLTQYLIDILTTFVAGSVVALAFFFFQNSNGFAPGGVGGLATITYALLGGKVSWTFLMLAFNIPIFTLVSIFVNTWRRAWHPTPGFLPGESHRQRSLAGYSPWGHKRVRHNLAHMHTRLNKVTRVGP